MKRIIASVLLVITTTADLGAHDTFLKFESHYLQPQSQVTVALMNGTIDVSESSVAVDRMRDVRIVGPGQLSEQQDNNQWALTEKLSTLGFMTGGPGTYVAGVSIKPGISKCLQPTSTDISSTVVFSTSSRHGKRKNRHKMLLRSIQSMSRLFFRSEKNEPAAFDTSSITRSRLSLRRILLH